MSDPALPNFAKSSPTAGSHASPRWREIDSELAAMLKDPTSVTDSDGVPPSKESIVCARRLLPVLRMKHWEPPKAAVADGDGGLLLEWLNEFDSQTIEISESGKMEQVQIQNGRRVSRRPIDLSLA